MEKALLEETRENRRSSGPAVRVVELYCGIGGLATALPGGAEVVAALDINRNALEVYRHNFPHPSASRTLDAISAEEAKSWLADLWWLSPPCQPFTRRGIRRDDEDPRSRSLLRLIDLLDHTAPRYLALENVPGFRGSRTHARLCAALERNGFEVREEELCPTAFGVPNRRSRFYLVAGRGPLRTPEPPVAAGRPLSSYLDPTPAAELRVDPGLVRRYRGALDIVRADDPEAVTACFTSAYGRSPVRSGSYLDTEAGLRRFSPDEILRLLGFPASYALPPGLPLVSGWRLVGNSLSIAPVRWLLSAIPGLEAYSAAGDEPFVHSEASTHP
jgi:site-specific DNA-cytosine methylase